MPNGIRTQRNFNGGEPFQEDLRNRSNIIIGALICGGGLALLTFVGMQFYIALKDHTDKFIALYLLASIFLFSLTTYILFSLINFSGQNLKLPRSTLIVVATYAAIAGIYFIFHIFFSYHPPAQEITETHFVLALDADDKGIPQHVIEWSAKPHAKPLLSGALAGVLPTVFGSLLTIAFGIWFPQIMLQDVTSAFDVAQKLAAPVLGLGLVGIGVAQQADTAKMQTDIELVEKGLPPSIHLSDNQRAYILTKNNISAESATYIQNQMDYVHDQLQEISSTQSSMSTTLNQKPGYQGEEIQAFQARIANLQNQLDSAKIQINQISNQNRVSEAQMEATGRYLSQINTTLTTGNTARQAYECTLLQLELQKVDPLQPIVIRDVHESLAKLDAHERENILQRAGHFITGYNAIANASGPGQEAEAERIKTSLKKAYDENCLADAKTSVAVSAVDSGH